MQHFSIHAFLGPLGPLLPLLSPWADASCVPPMKLTAFFYTFSICVRHFLDTFSSLTLFQHLFDTFSTLFRHSFNTCSTLFQHMFCTFSILFDFFLHLSTLFLHCFYAFSTLFLHVLDTCSTVFDTFSTAF